MIPAQSSQDWAAPVHMVFTNGDVVESCSESALLTAVIWTKSSLLKGIDVNQFIVWAAYTGEELLVGSSS